MNVITLMAVVAFLSEALTEILKQAIPIRDKQTYLLSIVVGVALAFTFKTDLFNLTGPGHYASIILCGVLASRGSNYINGLLKQIGIITGRS
ncbi:MULTISPECIES: hypothetical protein [unclassified Paenibacillus]|uniref:hypothetical protein n=1 Tax=unclassified Paenibacillus TaxID=185978 RepID=UPI0030D7CD7A